MPKLDMSKISDSDRRIAGPSTAPSRFLPQIPLAECSASGITAESMMKVSTRRPNIMARLTPKQSTMPIYKRNWYLQNPRPWEERKWEQVVGDPVGSPEQEKTWTKERLRIIAVCSMFELIVDFGRVPLFSSRDI